MARLRKELLDLSLTVTTHPFWATVDKGEVVQARMVLKHAHEAVGVDGRQQEKERSPGSEPDITDLRPRETVAALIATTKATTR
ncbi:hypothetical protein OG379_01140 [Streptomyces sp. NBC_01166]|uniref:hypothetical protein n=1 Tax=Streptomyces sp. NBC_01166 TaxID=2903755 RepID=UPI00386DA0D7|nr:hypothetical protein OG379_01140 [Streptomyces sp. NBC_01166]